ncbi:MAG TPA: DUF6602 domain-containing protein [Thermodesulfobacteriota bacterium]|nr:DUF6602 domain-containing protein [Thermodesulfobacteriota bacterium]
MDRKNNSKDTIRNYSSALVKGFIEQSHSISSLGHNPTKGQLRELFVTNILNSFLSSQFEVGTGTIINQKGEESDQTDVIIYDNRTIPPFIKEHHIGVYPAESVIGAIEVKSRLSKAEIESAEASAQKLHKDIFNPLSKLYKDYNFTPFCGVIGFYGTGARELSDPQKGKDWLNSRIDKMFGLCLIGKYSWINVAQRGWVFHDRDEKTHEETKAFISVLLDNIRTQSVRRVKAFERAHRDWLSIYIRHQNLFTE